MAKISIIGFIFLLAACSSENNSFSDQYQYKVNGCDTGVHKFEASSAAELKDKICKALQDENLNRGCAWEMRRKHYEKSCQ